MSLMLLSCILKCDKMVNFMLYIFFLNFLKRERWSAELDVAERSGGGRTEVSPVFSVAETDCKSVREILPTVWMTLIATCKPSGVFSGS